jgi:hypothetical protein
LSKIIRLSGSNICAKVPFDGAAAARRVVRSQLTQQNFKANSAPVDASRAGDLIFSMDIRSGQSTWMQMCNQSLSRPSAQLQLEAACCGSVAVRKCQWVLLARTAFGILYMEMVCTFKTHAFVN